jgi:DNA polymerase-4
MTRRILHIDMDAFFASVERVLDPSLEGKPVIVGGNPDGRGVVCTASYEARAFGVHSAMPLATAKRLCPDAVFIQGHFDHYRDASDQVMNILEAASPRIERLSLDEAYLDITGSLRLFGSGRAIATKLRREIRERTGLAGSVGIAENKLVAKIASDEAKPDGFLEVPPGRERLFLAPLPVSRLPGVGSRTRETLDQLGVHTIGHLAVLPQEALTKVFGGSGYALQRRARGIDFSPVEQFPYPKSVGRETTFPEDLVDWHRIESVLYYLMEKATYALREQRMETRCVTLKVRYADFKTLTLAKTLPQPTDLDTVVYETVRELLPRAKSRRARVRLVGVSLSSLVHNQHQLSLFPTKAHEKWRRALAAVDRVRDRYGFDLLRSARTIQLGRDFSVLTPSLSQ